MDVPQVDDDLLRKQQEAYRVHGVDENEQITPAQLRNKRKQQAGSDEVSEIIPMLNESMRLEAN